MKRTQTLALAAALACGAALALSGSSHAEGTDLLDKLAKVSAEAQVEPRLPDDYAARAMPAAKRQRPDAQDLGATTHTACALGAIDYRGEADTWTFTVGPSDRYVLVEMDRIGSGELDPFVAIYDPWERLVAYNDDESPFSLNSAVQFRPAWTGTYRIRAMAYDHASTGKYMLWLHKSDRPIGPH